MPRRLYGRSGGPGTGDRQAYVVYDGNELRTFRDAVAAVAIMARAKGRCSVIDLNLIRMETAE